MIKEVKSKLTKCQHTQNKEKGLLLTETACNKIKQNCRTFENIEFSLIKSLNKDTLEETCHKLLKKVNIAQKKTTKEIQAKIIKQRIEKNNKNLIENPKFFYHRLFGAQNIIKEIINDNNIIQTNPEICIELIHKWWSKLFSQPTKKKKKIPKILQEYFKKFKSCYQLRISTQLLLRNTNKGLAKDL
jgi:hypothetical protein